LDQGKAYVHCNNWKILFPPPYISFIPPETPFFSLLKNFGMCFPNLNYKNFGKRIPNFLIKGKNGNLGGERNFCSNLSFFFNPIYSLFSFFNLFIKYLLNDILKGTRIFILWTMNNFFDILWTMKIGYHRMIVFKYGNLQLNKFMMGWTI
jgi:hypothetical protein